MNVRTLNRKIGRGMTATRVNRATIEVTGGGLKYRVADQAGGNETETAAYLRSKMPVKTVIPQ